MRKTQIYIFSYTDDMAVVFHGHEVKIKAEMDIFQIATWVDNNILTLNTAKTNYICFSIYKDSQPGEEVNIKVHPCEVWIVRELGHRFIMNSNCNFPNLY